MNLLHSFYPAAGRAFIRRITTADTYANSPILIPIQAREKVAKHQFEVVKLGDYERCEDPEECKRPHHKGFLHKHRLKVGDWVLARNRSWAQTPDPDVFVIWQRDILAVFQERPDETSAHNPHLRPDRDVAGTTGG